MQKLQITLFLKGFGAFFLAMTIFVLIRGTIISVETGHNYFSSDEFASALPDVVWFIAAGSTVVGIGALIGSRRDK